MRTYDQKVSRIHAALQRAGGDNEGPLESLQEDLLDLLELIPAEVALREITKNVPQG